MPISSIRQEAWEECLLRSNLGLRSLQLGRRLAKLVSRLFLEFFDFARLMQGSLATSVTSGFPCCWIE